MPDTSAPALPLFAVLTEVGIIAQLSRAMLESNAPDGLTMPMFGVLNHLARLEDNPTPLALARAFQQPKTSMTHTLMMLEKKALIVMRPNPADGRSKLVHLTDKGAALRGQTMAALSETYAGLGEDIGIERLAELLPLLTELRQQLDALRD